MIVIARLPKEAVAISIPDEENSVRFTSLREGGGFFAESKKDGRSPATSYKI